MATALCWLLASPASLRCPGPWSSLWSLPGHSTPYTASVAPRALIQILELLLPGLSLPSQPHFLQSLVPLPPLTQATMPVALAPSHLSAGHPTVLFPPTRLDPNVTSFLKSSLNLQEGGGAMSSPTLQSPCSLSSRHAGFPALSTSCLQSLCVFGTQCGTWQAVQGNIWVELAVKSRRRSDKCLNDA